jgi:hypothetical protein
MRQFFLNSGKNSTKINGYKDSVLFDMTKGKYRADALKLEQIPPAS